MTILRAVSCLSVCAVALLGATEAQTLAELARQEAARRQSVPRGPVITNADLKPVPAPSPGSVASPPYPAPGTPSAGATRLPPPPELGSEAPADSPAPEAQEGEAHWRKRVASVREDLARSQVLKAALEARIGALTLDFVNRDDPVQRDLVEADRLAAIAELDRVTRDIGRHQEELLAIAEDARRAGVPAGWVR